MFLAFLVTDFEGTIINAIKLWVSIHETISKRAKTAKKNSKGCTVHGSAYWHNSSSTSLFYIKIEQTVMQ